MKSPIFLFLLFVSTQSFATTGPLVKDRPGPPCVALSTDCAGIPAISVAEHEAWVRRQFDIMYPQLPPDRLLVHKVCVQEFGSCYYLSYLRTMNGIVEYNLYLESSTYANISRTAISKLDSLGVKLNKITNQASLDQQVSHVQNTSIVELARYFAEIPDERWNVYEASTYCGLGAAGCAIGTVLTAGTAGLGAAATWVDCAATIELCTTAIRNVGKYMIWKERKVKEEREKAVKEKAEAASSGGSGGSGTSDPSDFQPPPPEAIPGVCLPRWSSGDECWWAPETMVSDSSGGFAITSGHCVCTSDQFN